MKDKHNIILILVSSKWLIPYSGGSSYHILGSRCFIFSFPRVPNSRNYIIAKLHPNHRKASTLCFSSLISCDHPFVTGVLHGCSTCWFIKDSIPSRSVPQDSSHRSSSVLHLAIRSAISFYRIFGGGIMSFLIIWVHVSWFTCWFKSINLFVGTILGYISPKAFPKDRCYLWCL